MNQGDPNGPRLRLPALRWSTVLLVIVTVSLAFQWWLAYRSVEEWSLARQAQAGISSRVAQRELSFNKTTGLLLNELKLQTFYLALPTDEQRRMIPTLFHRLNDESKDTILTLRLRSLGAIGEQEAPNEVERRRR